MNCFFKIEPLYPLSNSTYILELALSHSKDCLPCTNPQQTRSCCSNMTILAVCYQPFFFRLSSKLCPETRHWPACAYSLESPEFWKPPSRAIIYAANGWFRELERKHYKAVMTIQNVLLSKSCQSLQLPSQGQLSFNSFASWTRAPSNHQSLSIPPL